MSSNSSDLPEHQPLDIHQKMDTLSETLTTLICDASEASIPRSNVINKSKPWWNDTLRDLRKDIIYLDRRSRKDPNLRPLYIDAKNLYFNSLKRTKTDY